MLAHCSFLCWLLIKFVQQAHIDYYCFLTSCFLLHTFLLQYPAVLLCMWKNHKLDSLSFSLILINISHGFDCIVLYGYLSHRSGSLETKQENSIAV